ncbi:nucleoside hydrolase [Panus rudis PR-1116 ss-1]|nr:nucleoside hydrolase [Panus rudis PR-1116 ss-1]
MTKIWLDCDPGHDDATAIMLAIHCPGIELLGVSTVHGNTSVDNTTVNAARCLVAFGASHHVKVYPGAVKPLIRLPRYDPEIHGESGIEGVEGLPDGNDPRVRERLVHADGTVRAIEGLARAVHASWLHGNGEKIVVISTGPMTNIALFVSVYPELLVGIEEFVFMGGGVGMGNRSSAAEFNILCDPEACQIVLDAPLKKTMIPLNVTHTAIVTKSVHASILSPGMPLETSRVVSTITNAATPLRHMLSTLLTFFADSYKMVFGFHDGPPLHDALTIAYVYKPELFNSKRYRVDVELSGTHTSGETVVDIWNYRKCDDSWGPNGRNCMIAEKLDVHEFFTAFLECIAEADKVSPLNMEKPNI